MQTVRKTPVVGVVAAVTLLAAGVFGANAYARNTICSSLRDGSTLGSLAGGSSAQANGDDLAHMREAGTRLRAYGHVLVFEHDLRSAVNGIAGDVDQLADLMSSGKGDGIARLITLAGSVDTHVGEAQEACGLPVTGLRHG